jgi:hypothetical protein
MDIKEIVAALCEMAVQQAEERGYRRAMDKVEGRERHAERVIETERNLYFPCTFQMTQDHIGWLIAGHKDAYIEGGRWNLRVPIEIPSFKDISGGSVMMGGQGYNTLHARKRG